MVSQHVFDRFHDDGVFATGEAGLACLEVRCGYRRRRTSAALRNTMDNTKTCSGCSCTAADTAGDGTSRYVAAWNRWDKTDDSVQREGVGNLFRHT